VNLQGYHLLGYGVLEKFAASWAEHSEILVWRPREITEVTSPEGRAGALLRA
jgi:hypothetical protein